MRINGKIKIRLGTIGKEKPLNHYPLPSEILFIFRDASLGA
jgi:hypothetical protein